MGTRYVFRKCMGTTGSMYLGDIWGQQGINLGDIMGDNKGILGRDIWGQQRYVLWRYGDDVLWRYVTFYPSWSLPYLVVTPDERPPLFTSALLIKSN